jgi:hypothetical protein
MRRGAAVPFTPLEVAMWTCLGTAVVLGLVTASSGQRAPAVALVAVFVGCLASAHHLHTSRPDLFAHRVPNELLWLIGVAGLVGATALFAGGGTGSKAAGLLLGLGILGLVANELTRERPKLGPSPPPMPGGRFLGPTTAAGLTWRRRFGEVLWAIGMLASVIAWVVFNRYFGIVGVVTLTAMIFVWEAWWWVAKRRGLGYFAPLDD